jgi:hypothetical protein
MQGYVDCPPQAVGAALDEPTETGREWAGKRKATKGLERSRIDAQDVLNRVELLQQLVKPRSHSDHSHVTSKRHDVSDCGRAEKRADGSRIRRAALVFVTPVLRLGDALRLAAHRPVYLSLEYQSKW